jgi:putative Mn2+ efflux pump MntP
MGFLELFLIAVGLSMDAFAVALSKGLCMSRLNLKNALVIASLFGGFQAAMPFLGWLMGRQFENYIRSADHWIAFVLLGFIGGKMIYEVFQEEECPKAAAAEALNIGELLLLAVATSIDALAVGITFAFLQVSILPSVLLIGATTFAISFAGVCIGHPCGTGLKSKAEFAGGMVLILIGTKILFQHLFLFS